MKKHWNILKVSKNNQKFHSIKFIKMQTHSHWIYWTRCQPRKQASSSSSQTLRTPCLPACTVVSLFSLCSRPALSLPPSVRLIFNPHERITVDEALAHPYFKSLHNPKTEHACSRAFDFEFEKIHMTKEVLQEFMWQEIQVRGKHDACPMRAQ